MFLFLTSKYMSLFKLIKSFPSQAKTTAKEFLLFIILKIHLVFFFIS